jgi:hypothetical protein
LDSQFDHVMGSPYLLAHGNGHPVADATTTMSAAEAGEYNVWVRAKDWVPGHHPGRFQLRVNGTELSVEFGANDKDWNWKHCKKIQLEAGKVDLALRDLTGFQGRCDAMFFSLEDVPPPARVDVTSRAWRRKFSGLPATPVDGGHFSVVVIGGGLPGTQAALTAARLGEQVALIHDRPFIGGNASLEIGLSPRGITGKMMRRLAKRDGNGELEAHHQLMAEPNVTIFWHHTVYGALMGGPSIRAVVAKEAKTRQEVRITAPIFIDCSGKAIFGPIADADTMFGRKSRAEYGEGHELVEADEIHHGNTLFFRTKMADSPVLFPEVPLAVEVAKDYAQLHGQLVRLGLENGPGPAVGAPWHAKRKMIGLTDPDRMELPCTHYWEYGQFLDPYQEAEHIRDHLLKALYGTFSNVKAMEPERWDNLTFDQSPSYQAKENSAATKATTSCQRTTSASTQTSQTP